jgi:hypothetical protein
MITPSDQQFVSLWVEGFQQSFMSTPSVPKPPHNVSEFEQPAAVSVISRQSMAATWTPSVIWRAVQLFQSGMSAQDIHKKFPNIPYHTIYHWCHNLPKKVLEWKKAGERGSGGGAKTAMGAELEFLIGKLWATARDYREETTRRLMMEMARELLTKEAFQASEKWFRNVRRLIYDIVYNINIFHRCNANTCVRRAVYIQNYILRYN